METLTARSWSAATGEGIAHCLCGTEHIMSRHVSHGWPTLSVTVTQQSLPTQCCTVALRIQTVCTARRFQAVSRGQRLVPVLLACGINPQQPGEYNITFAVTSSTGLGASVRRRLVIKAACPKGEKLCPDKVRAIVVQEDLVCMVRILLLHEYCQSQ